MIHSIVKAEQWHVEPIARNARQKDINECWLAAAVSFEEALRRSFEGTEYSITWLVRGEPAAMGGIRRIGDGGIIWILGSNFIDKYPRYFLLHSQEEFVRVREGYENLLNFIDVDNEKYIKWLLWMGFHFEGPIPHGPFRKPFYKFEWRKEVNDRTI